MACFFKHIICGLTRRGAELEKGRERNNSLFSRYTWIIQFFANELYNQQSMDMI